MHVVVSHLKYSRLYSLYVANRKQGATLIGNTRAHTAQHECSFPWDEHAMRRSESYDCVVSRFRDQICIVW